MAFRSVLDGIFKRGIINAMATQQSSEPGWRNDYPDWRDVKGPIETALADGRIVTGRLVAIDAIVVGDDEAPVWSLALPDGTIIDHVPLDRWRVVAA